MTEQDEGLSILRKSLEDRIFSHSLTEGKLYIISIPSAYSKNCLCGFPKVKQDRCLQVLVHAASVGTSSIVDVHG